MVAMATSDEDDVPAETDGKRSYSVPAAEKALDVIELMAGQPDGLTLTEIAAMLERSVHELYRVIQTLEARGYLYRRAGSDRYRFSLKLFELAHQMPSMRQLSDSALPVMQVLAPAAQQSCHLAVLSGHEALIVLQVDSPLPMRYSVMLGAKFDFAETSSGVVIYALSSPGIREQLDAWLLQDSRTAEAIAQVARRAAAIAAAGHEVQPSLAVSGVTNVSVPVFDYLGHVVAALTVPYMPQRAATVPLEKVRELALEASREISRNLGAGASVAAAETNARGERR